MECRLAPDRDAERGRLAPNTKNLDSRTVLPVCTS
jgi:hypothetical protein